MLEDAFNKAPNVLDFYHIPISAAPITDAFIDDENLYLAVACKIVILNKKYIFDICFEAKFKILIIAPYLQLEISMSLLRLVAARYQCLRKLERYLIQNTVFG